MSDSGEAGAEMTTQDPSNRTAGTIKVCPRDGDPVVFTFEHPGTEWLCVTCDWRGDIFAPREVSATEALVARHDELVDEYMHRRGIDPPDQDRPHPTCNACGTEAVGRLDHSGKPAHWYCRRTIDGVTEYACSRGCINGGVVAPW